MLIGIRTGLDAKKKGEKDFLKLPERHASGGSLLKPS